MEQKQTIRLFSFLLPIIMIFGFCYVVFSAEENGTTDSTWYQEAEEYMNKHNLMIGTASGDFDPENPMTRSMLVTILHRIEGTPSVSIDASFSDVPANAYYRNAVSWAAFNNIVNGTSSNQFTPDSPITREQFVTILYRYANVMGYDTLGYAEFDGYSDLSEISSYAEASMHWAVGSQIIKGSSGRLMPSGSTTRAQAATILMRFIENIEDNTEEIKNNMINVQIGEDLFTATLVDNSTTEALIEMLSKGPITINMQDYGNMEKVGSLGTSLPRNDESITTEPGDLILYQGNAFVIYYEPNSWNFTRIGKINNATQKELKEALGSGDVIVTLSLDQN